MGDILLMPDLEAYHFKNKHSGLETMEFQEQKSSTLANLRAYSAEYSTDYVNGAPHVKHSSLRELYVDQLLYVLSLAREFNSVPRVLDLGAGEGSVTFPMLEFGLKVTAVDVSKTQLDLLARRCARFAENLHLHCDDIHSFLEKTQDRFEIVTANSFLHHVPDYMAVLQQAIQTLNPGGVFFSFQDPMKYSSLKRRTKAFSDFAYFTWRIRQGDVFGGLKRHFRRRKGVYLDECYQDNAEYHVLRGGVDQQEIRSFFEANGFKCRVKTYFSTQSRFLQRIGETLRVKNTFSFIAHRSDE